MIYTDGKHLVATTLDELHAFAQSIALDRRWFQAKGYQAHYLITSPKMLERAVDAGAIKTNDFNLRLLAQRTVIKDAKTLDPKVKRPMTEEEEQIALALVRCRFGFGSWDKRFCKDMIGKTEITEKQAEWLRKMAYRYRRQLGEKWIELNSGVRG